jgi:starch phosphorylase
VESLLHRDDYMLFADYQAYVDGQQKVSEAYRDQKNWTRMSILNSARVGRFSSDRSIREYCRDIWNASPIGTETHMSRRDGKYAESGHPSEAHEAAEP